MRLNQFQATSKSRKKLQSTNAAHLPAPLARTIIALDWLACRDHIPTGRQFILGVYYACIYPLQGTPTAQEGDLLWRLCERYSQEVLALTEFDGFAILADAAEYLSQPHEAERQETRLS